MTQRNVERAVGRLITDEDFRARFKESPMAAVEQLVLGGWELTPGEREAIAALEPEQLESLARRVDPRIRRASLNTGAVAPMAEEPGKERA